MEHNWKCKQWYQWHTIACDWLVTLQQINIDQWQKCLDGSDWLPHLLNAVCQFCHQFTTVSWNIQQSVLFNVQYYCAQCWHYESDDLHKWLHVTDKIGLTVYLKLWQKWHLLFTMCRAVPSLICCLVSGVYLKNHMSKFHQVLCTCYLWMWLSSPLMQCNTLCISRIVTDIMFPYNGSNRPE